MCGIAGFFRKESGNEEIIKKINETLRHRGPDAEGFFQDSSVGLCLGHTRLSIRDLSQAGA